MNFKASGLGNFDHPQRVSRVGQRGVQHPFGFAALG